EFDMPIKDSHIINGHVPVKQSKGESPLKADGKLIVIDGGFSKAYQSTTGIAGYTLVYHSHGLQLVQHEPFESTQKAIDEGADIKSTSFLLEFTSKRMRVRDTDKGRILNKQIQDLRKLLVGYRMGLIKEKN
ncbi:MAG: fructose-bisphosphatase class III, partial [Bacteroidaceae bacterium]